MMIPAEKDEHPSAKAMKVDVNPSPAERMTMFVLIAFGLAGGTGLLAIARRSEA